MSSNSPIKNLGLIFAGDARFTLSSKKTRVRYTYHIRLAPIDPRYKSRCWFVSVLTGQDNVHDYTYIGYIKPDKRTFVNDNKPRPMSFAKSAGSILAFIWLLQSLDTPEKIIAQADVFHEGHCLKCGKLLTTPESVAAGLGPVCIER